MSLKGITTLTTLAVAAALGFSGFANANYTYTTTFATGNPGTPPFATPSVDSTSGTPAVITYTGQSSTPSGSGTFPVGNLGISNSGATVSFNAFYTIEVTITNNSATGNFFIFGFLTGTNVTSSSGSVSNIYEGLSTMNVLTPSPSATQSIGGQLFTVSEPIGTPSNQNFSAPTVGAGPTSGGFSAAIAVTVPEPASAVMVGLGLGGVGLVWLRSRRVRV
jgi:hypothetical protein